MRVVHVVQTLVAGGAETMIRTLCPALATAGVDVTIVSVYDSGLDRSAVGSLGVPVVNLRRGGRRDLGYFPRLVRELRALRPDVVHAHLHTGQYAGRLAAVLAAAPAIVFTSHGDEPGGPVRALADRLLHARTARFVVFTEAQRRRFAAEQQVAADRIAVIANGVAAPRLRARDDVRAEIGIPPEAFAVSLVGRLAPEKNHRAAIDALGILDDARIRLVLAGTGPLDAELRDYARSRGRDPSVVFLGHRADAPELAAGMDLFLLPSLRERMPIALAEAMLAGLPVAVTPWEGVRDLIADDETGYVADGFDGAALGAVIARAVGDPARRARIAESGRRTAAERFSVETMVDAHLALYAGIVRNRAA